MKVELDNLEIEDFNNYDSNIELLKLVNCKIKSFNGLSNLKELNIKNCKIENRFIWPENLIKINVNQTIFDFFPDQWPEKIKCVVFKKSNLTQIPDHWPEKIKYIDFQNNQISKIPDYWPDTVKDINFDRNQLIEIPDRWPENDQLRILEFGHNQLTKIPDRWPVKNHIQNLVFSHNRLSKIPDHWPNCYQIDFIDFSNNQLTEIPDQWPENDQIGYLSYINFSNNQLTRIPDQWPITSKSINIDKRRKKQFGPETVSLKNNKITKVPNYWNTNMMEIDLSHNLLTEIPKVDKLELEHFKIDDNPFLDQEYYSELLKLQFNIKINNKIKSLNIRNLLNPIIDNNQTVHHPSIEDQFIKIYNRLIEKYPIDFKLEEFESCPEINDDTKSKFISMINNSNKLEKLNLTFAEVFALVWSLIKNHGSSSEIKKLLNLEFKYIQCIRGTAIKLLNILSGFYPEVEFQLTPQQHINNVLGEIVKKSQSYDEIKSQAIEKLKDYYSIDEIMSNVDQILG